MKAPANSNRAAENRLLGLFEDLLMDKGATNLVSFLDHIGLKLLHRPTDQWWPAFLAHYLVKGRVDEDRVARDMATWGPIASRVMELRIEQGAAVG